MKLSLGRGPKFAGNRGLTVVIGAGLLSESRLLIINRTTDNKRVYRYRSGAVTDLAEGFALIDGERELAPDQHPDFLSRV